MQHHCISHRRCEHYRRDCTRPTVEGIREGGVSRFLARRPSLGEQLLLLLLFISLLFSLTRFAVSLACRMDAMEQRDSQRRELDPRRVQGELFVSSLRSFSPKLTTNPLFFSFRRTVLDPTKQTPLLELVSSRFGLRESSSAELTHSRLSPCFLPVQPLPSYSPRMRPRPTLSIKLGFLVSPNVSFLKRD